MRKNKKNTNLISTEGQVINNMKNNFKLMVKKSFGHYTPPYQGGEIVDIQNHKFLLLFKEEYPVRQLADREEVVCFITNSKLFQLIP